MTVIILRMICGMTVVVMMMMIYYDGVTLVYTNHSNVQCLCNSLLFSNSQRDFLTAAKPH